MEEDLCRQERVLGYGITANLGRGKGVERGSLELLQHELYDNTNLGIRAVCPWGSWQAAWRAATRFSPEAPWHPLRQVGSTDVRFPRLLLHAVAL